MRTAIKAVLLISGFLLFHPAAHAAATCRSNYFDGKVHIICNESGQMRYTCGYELPIMYEKTRTTLTGKFELPRGAKDLRALSLAHYKGKRITGIGGLKTACASKPVVVPEARE